jgi:hypothetical protein
MLLRARSRQANSPSPRGDEEGVSFQQRFRWGLLEFTRRRVLEILTGGLTVTIVLPSRWVKPIVESVIVPAHAQAWPVKAALRGTTSTTSTSTTSTFGSDCRAARFWRGKTCLLD